MGAISGVGPVISTISAADGLGTSQRYELANLYLQLQSALSSSVSTDTAPEILTVVYIAQSIANLVTQTSPNWSALAKLGAAQSIAVNAVDGVSDDAKNLASEIKDWLAAQS